MKTFTRRDLVLCPLLALVTAIGCLAGAEALARIVMPVQLVNRCEIVPMVRFQPNCVSTIKVGEGPMTTQRYNDCGYRSSKSCRDTPPDDFRVAVIGTSISQGFAVRYDDTYVARAENDLARLCHRPVDFQTIGADWPTFPDDPAASVLTAQGQEILRLRPSVLLVFVSSWDLFKYHDKTADGPPRSEGNPSPGLRFAQPFKFLSGFMDSIRKMREQSRFVLMARSILYRNDAYFIQTYLSNSDESDFLRKPLSPAWLTRLSMLETVLGRLDQAAKATNTPMALVYVPMTEAQVVIARERMTSGGLDPYALQQGLAAIAERHQWALIDTLATYVNAPPSQPGFYVADGHPNANGHRAIADSIVSAIVHSKTMTCQS